MRTRERSGRRAETVERQLLLAIAKNQLREVLGRELEELANDASRVGLEAENARAFTRDVLLEACAPVRRAAVGGASTEHRLVLSVAEAKLTQVRARAADRWTEDLMRAQEGANGRLVPEAEIEVLAHRLINEALPLVIAEI